MGAVYTGQYAKGLAHLAIMVLLIVGISSDPPTLAIVALGISIGFFYVYQIIDAIRTAKAIQEGQPAPDPFGLAQTFGTGEKFESTKVPLGAAVLIGLGVVFLLGTVFDFSVHRIWPIILIVLGVWLFAKHWGLLGTYRPACVCERCRTSKLMGPAILVTLGVIFLLHSVSRVDIWRTWPAILLVIGVVKLMQGNASSSGHFGPLPPGMYPGVPQNVPQNVSQNVPPNVPPSAPPPPPATQNPEPPASSGTSSGTSGEVNNV